MVCNLTECVEQRDENWSRPGESGDKTDHQDHNYITSVEVGYRNLLSIRPHLSLN